MKKPLTFLRLALTGLLSACGLQRPQPMEPLPQHICGETPLMAVVTSQEEAEALAALYGITLVKAGYRVATFRTEEDPRDVIQRGQNNGWPALELNQVQTAY